ncbi:MAG TPA: hypothetical protein VFV84_10805, partial [Burkholderiales bacterium]|nr:hypothetical protein [Burkholderiales bacterium]
NAINGFINASRQNVPMLLCAGRSPLTEGPGLAGARNNYIHWAQEHFDQGAMLREFAKWDYELKDADQVGAAVDRGLAIAASDPQGPVYLTLPREILAAPLRRPADESPLQVPVSPPLADPEALEEAARLLGRAQKPLLITANGGRTPEGSAAISALAEQFAVGVVQYRPRYMAISTEHPMHLGWDPHSALKEADLVLVVDCDVPWIPRQGGPRDEAKVVHLGPDPLFARYPMRAFRTDLAVAGRVAPTLERLRELAARHAPSAKALQARREAITSQSAALRTKGRGAGGGALTSQFASACLNGLLGEDALLVNEYPLVLEEMTIREPGRYYGTPPSGGLGWGLG